MKCGLLEGTMLQISKQQMEGILKRMQDPLASPSEKATAKAELDWAMAVLQHESLFVQMGIANAMVKNAAYMLASVIIAMVSAIMAATSAYYAYVAVIQSH
jgi:hypothetical protein